MGIQLESTSSIHILQYNSIREEVLYNILIEFRVPMKLVRLIKMCLNETYSKVCLGKHLDSKGF
jgi:hypothetical protein